MRNGELPFHASIKSKDGSASSMRISDVKLIGDGVEKTLIDDELTISTNTVKLEGEEIQESSARLSVPLQSPLEPEILLHGNATISNQTPRHAIELSGGHDELKIQSTDGMYAVIRTLRQRDEGFRYFDVLFGAKGQPETVDSDGRKSRPHIAISPDGNGMFIRLAGYRCTLHSRLHYDLVTKDISPAIIIIDPQDFAQKLVLKFEYQPVDAKVVLTEAAFE